MPNTVTIQATPDFVRKLIGIHEDELVLLRKSVADKVAEIDELKKALGEIGGYDAPVVVDKNPKSGRAPRGDSKSAILAFLQTHKGSGWTQSQISAKTGTSMSTAGRVLQSLAKDGQIDSVGNTWGCSL